MYKYQIQINDYNNGLWDWIAVYAENDVDALLRATWEIANDGHFKEYHVSQIFSKEEINYAHHYKNDIISSSSIIEESDMTFFKVNWNNYTEQLEKLAATEVWSNDTYPNNGILANYLIHTFEKLKSEKNIITTKEYGLFNTGLFTNYYEPIYAYQKGQEDIIFMTDYDLGNIGIKERPERANYFEEPSLLLFDWHYQINIQYKHILDDVKNKTRIPQDILDGGNIVTILDGAINTMKKRVSAKYKLAIPQYFSKQVQLLLPLCLKTDNIPDLALAVIKKNGYYQGHSCITLDMAYNNARLIAKPESNWLMP